MHLAHYRGLLHRARFNLGDAFGRVADGHHGEPDVFAICSRLAGQCQRQAEQLPPLPCVQPGGPGRTGSAVLAPCFGAAPARRHRPAVRPAGPLPDGSRVGHLLDPCRAGRAGCPRRGTDPGRGPVGSRDSHPAQVAAYPDETRRRPCRRGVGTRGAFATGRLSTADSEPICRSLVDQPSIGVATVRDVTCHRLRWRRVNATDVVTGEPIVHCGQSFGVAGILQPACRPAVRL